MSGSDMIKAPLPEPPDNAHTHTPSLLGPAQEPSLPEPPVDDVRHSAAWLPAFPIAPLNSTDARRQDLVRAFAALGLFLGLLGVSIAGFVVARRKVQSDAPRSSDGEQGNQKGVINTIAFLYALFSVATVILAFGIYKSAVRIARVCIYPPLPSTALTPTEMEELVPRNQPRMYRILFGPPPSEYLRQPVSLPSYHSALRQAARQGARRRAAEIGVSAGRRGREVYGTGDPEDLEVERILRLGGSPPQYRSTTMRKDPVLQKGPKPERRLSILSLFSNTSSTSNPASPAVSTSNRLANVFRRFSNRSSVTEPSSPASLARVVQQSSEGKGDLEYTAVTRDGTIHAFPPKPAPRRGTGRDEVDEKAIIQEEEEDLASMEAVMYAHGQGRMGEAVI